MTNFNTPAVVYQESQVLTESLLQMILELEVALFPKPFSEKEVRDRLTQGKSVSIIVAIAAADSGPRPVGYKCGFELDAGRFYSWIGGVLPEYRNQGIAKELMKRQHAHCKKMGFSKVQTKTLNKFKNMLILNLKYGFEITDTYRGEDGDLRIVLEKNIKESQDS